MCGSIVRSAFAHRLCRAETKHGIWRSWSVLESDHVKRTHVFAGIGTTILLIGTGFGGGLMLARTAMEPVPPSRETAADRLQPVRLILPASAEAAPPPATKPAIPNSSPPVEDAQMQVPPPAEVRTEKEKPAERAENDKQAERAAQRKAEAEEREHRRRHAERRARREAARLKQQRDQQQDAARQDRPGIMAFGAAEHQDGPGGLFGN